MSHQGNEQNQPRADDRYCGRNAKESQAGANRDELGDQRQKIADHQVDHGEPSPERAEAVEDQLGMAAMRGRAQADGHLLYDACHQEGEHDEGQEEADAETGSGRSIREHAGPVIFSEHDQNAGADQQPQQASAQPAAALRTGCRNTLAIVRAIDVFVRDDDAAGGGNRTLQDVGVRSCSRLRRCRRVVHLRERVKSAGLPAVP